MVGVRILCAIVALASALCTAEPKSSADVVEVKLTRHSLADGLESYFVDIKVADGWHVYANVPEDTSSSDRAKIKPHPDAATVVEFLSDGKPTHLFAASWPPATLKKDQDGGEYLAYDERGASLTTWLGWELVQNTKVKVRMRVVATNGKTRLKEAIVTSNTVDP